jgi:hypothetical protein
MAYHIDRNLVAIYGLSYWSKFSQKTLPTLVVNKSLTHGWLLLPDIKDVMGKVRHAWPPATRKRDAIYGGRFMLCMYVCMYIYNLLYHIYILKISLIQHMYGYGLIYLPSSSQKLATLAAMGNHRASHGHLYIYTIVISIYVEVS